MSFRADIDTAAYARAMQRLLREEYPATVAETLNETADAVTKRSERYLKSRLTVRTKFTTNSLKRGAARPYHALNKAVGRNVTRMFSRAGSFSPYLGIQDTGGKQRPRSGSRYPIPTLRARIGRNAERRIAGRYNLGRMGDLGRNSRFFIGKPKPTGGSRPVGLYERRNNNKRLVMIRNLESRSVEIPASRWHRDAANELGSRRMIQARFRRAAQRRFARISR